MKAKLWNNDKFLIEFEVNKRYKSNKQIIPIGCDCHPAYMLDKLKLRKDSLPFDWLDTDSPSSIQYAFENINNQFEDFLVDLAKNENGKVFALKFKNALFYHYDDLIENNALQLKLKERCKKLLEFKKSKPCYFLSNISSSSIDNKQKVNFILKSIGNFQTILKVTDQLIIYLRYDENSKENQTYCDEFILKAKQLYNINIVQYIREKDKFGIWGDMNNYKSLMSQLGIKTRITFPELKFSKTRK